MPACLQCRDEGENLSYRVDLLKETETKFKESNSKPQISITLLQSHFVSWYL